MLQSKGGCAFAHTIDRTCECVSQETQRFALVRRLLPPGPRRLAGLVPSTAQSRRFRKGPLEVSVPHLVPRRAPACAPGVFRTLDESTIRRELLHPWEAIARVHCVEPDATEDLAHTRHRLQEVKGMGLGWLRRFEDQEFEGAEQRIRRGEQSPVDRHGLLHSRVVKPRGDAFTLGCIRDVLAALGQVIWRSGSVDMGPALRACAQQVGAASQHSTRRAPPGRLDRGCWKHPAAAQGGNRLRVDCVSFGRAAVKGFHRARVSQDKGHSFLSAEVGEPIPGEETCNGHDKAVAVGRNGLEKRCRSGVHIAVYEPLALLTHDTDVHASGM